MEAIDTSQDVQESATRRELKRTKETLSRKGEKAVHEGRTQLAETVRRLGEALATTGEELHSDENMFAAPLRRVGHALEDYAHNVGESSLNEITGGVRRFCRENPAIALGTCFTAGLIVARMMRAGGDNVR